MDKLVKSIEGFPNHRINIKGEIFVMDYLDSNNRRRNKKTIKQRLNSDGYPEVRITHDGKTRTTRVHRLMAETFLEKVEGKDTVNHIDGNKENNKLENLEWANRSEQLQHAYDLGLKKPTPVSRLMSKVHNSKPVKCLNKETGETTYHLTARDCSKVMGYSDRWCDKLISSQKGETKNFKIQYVSLDEVKLNTDKVDFSTLVQLVELWSIDKNIHKSDPTKQFLKVAEEFSEIASALARNNDEMLKDGIGDTIVTLIILAQQKNMNIMECLEYAFNEIKGRTGKMIDGVFVKSEDLK